MSARIPDEKKKYFPKYIKSSPCTNMISMKPIGNPRFNLKHDVPTLTVEDWCDIVKQMMDILDTLHS